MSTIGNLGNSEDYDSFCTQKKLRVKGMINDLPHFGNQLNELGVRNCTELVSGLT